MPDRPTIWVCHACGKTGETRETIDDESCWMHGVLVWADSVIYDARGRAVAAEAVPQVDTTAIHATVVKGKVSV